ncbi:Uma2 family endonuclease [Streptomyces verrucosisporus]|uniref:Uma2 family endonuclease n=1 Tax=Streptomyces verrucosisporus TaxID=1695161 RepID=UPI0019CFA72D|nr:Uma2 family endonuclease [Streptomyces verrucosisporus]MBN3931112.1 Uma2 family endonuclease [Streptomyces verrucosisporus]
MGGLVMTAPLPDQESHDMLRTYAQIELPEGQRAELIGGEIVISPTPTNYHNWVYAQLHRLLDRGTPDELVVTNTTTVALPATGERYVPDLLICESAVLRDAREWQVPAEDVLLVGEITSMSTVLRDRKNKAQGYGRSRVPLYLLVDPLDGEGSATVFAEPDGSGRYRVEHRVLFGERFTLPEPFGLEIDTSVLRQE